MEKTIKVLMINGSPRAEGNTALALHEMAGKELNFKIELVEVK